MYDYLPPHCDAPVAIRAQNQGHQPHQCILGQTRNKKGIYGRRKEQHFRSLGFPGLSFLENERTSLIFLQSGLDLPRVLLLPSHSTYFAVDTRRGTLQSLEAIFRVSIAARKNEMWCRRAWLVAREVDGLSCDVRNYSEGVPLRRLKLSIGSDSQDPECLSSLWLRTMFHEEEEQKQEPSHCTRKHLTETTPLGLCLGITRCMEGDFVYNWSPPGIGESMALGSYATGFESWFYHSLIVLEQIITPPQPEFLNM